MRTKTRLTHQRFSLLYAVLMILAPLLLVSLAGCAKESETDQGDQGEAYRNPKSVILDSSQDNIPNGSTRTGDSSKIRIDKNGQKWWNNHPYDIWFDDPLKVAADRTSVENGTSPSKTEDSSTVSKKKSAAEPEEKISAAGSDWKEILPKETISLEVKNIRNTLSATMKTVGKYNSNFAEIPAQAATLSMLAMILEKHPESLTWKEDALYVRDLGLSMEEAAEGRGRKNYDATLKPFEQFLSILDRNKPSNLAEPEKDVEFADRAYLGSMMKRMKKAYLFLKNDAHDEDIFKEKSRQVVHEARILAALAKFITDKSYDSSEEKEYLEHANGITDDALQIVAAGKNSDYKVFRDSIDRITNRCNQCHTAYRNRP